MNSAYDRIMNGESLESVFEEDGLLARVGNALSNLKSFSFGSGALSKAAGGSTPNSNAPISSKPGFVPANSLDDLRKNAQAQADRMKTPTSAPKPAASARPAMKPASESALPSFALSKSKSLSKSLLKTPKTSASSGLKAAAESYINSFR